jgi:ankyrin repeat protein
MSRTASLGDELITAVEQNEVAKATQLIRQGADVNYIDDFGFAPLFIAIRHKSINMVSLLVEHGANINFEHGTTPLMYAIDMANDVDLSKETFEKSLKIVKLLVNRGADVNYIHLGASPLTWALYLKRHKKLVKFLIEHGADVNYFGSNRITPLMIACTNGNEKLIYLLLHRGADPNIINNDGKTAFDLLKERHPTKYPQFHKKLQKDKFVTANEELWTLTLGNIDASTQRDMAEYMGIRKGGQRRTQRRRVSKRGRTRSQRKQ